MKSLDLVINSYNKWSTPWEFYDFIVQNKAVADQEKIVFKEKWDSASSFDLCNEEDLTKGCERARAFLNDRNDLIVNSVNAIIKAISFQWK